MTPKIRHQLFLPRALSNRLEVVAGRRGLPKSVILADAVAAWLDRQSASELEDRFALRLDRMTGSIGQAHEEMQVMLEALALFIRFELSIQNPLADDDRTGRALAARRFDAFVSQVGRNVAEGRRSLRVGSRPPSPPPAAPPAPEPLS